MKKNYSGNQKPFVLVLLAKDAKDRIMPLLEELDSRGLQLCVKGEGESCDKTAAKACATIAVLSEGFSKDGALQSALLKANEHSRQIIPVLADKSEQSEIVKRALFSLNAVDADKYSDVKAFADRLMTADVLKSPVLTDIQKKKSRRARTGIIGAAAVIALASAVFLSSKTKPEAEVPVETETPARPAIIDNYGWTEEELKSVKALIIYGDKIHAESNSYYNIWSVLDERWDDGARTWHTIEDDEEVAAGTITDLSFIEYFPNITNLCLVNQPVVTLPDMTAFKFLNSLEIWDCEISDIEGLRGSNVSSVHISCPVKDFSPLSDCKRLSDLAVMTGSQDYEFERLSGLKSDSLKSLQLHSSGIIDLSDIGNCPNITELEIIANNDYNRVDMSFLGKLTSLSTLYLEGFEGVDDLSALTGCTHLREIELQNMAEIRDLSYLGELPNLVEIYINSNNLENLNFLNSFGKRGRVTLGFRANSISDFSPLKAVDKYSSIICDLDGKPYSAIGDYIIDSDIGQLELHGASDIEFDSLPASLKRLAVYESDFTSIKDISGDEIYELTLKNNLRLKSLEGIENLNKLTNLTVSMCPVKDYEPLYSKNWNSLTLEWLDALPDFSRLSFGPSIRLELNYIDGVDSLDFFYDMPESEASKPFSVLNLSGLDEVTDLTPVKDLHGSLLIVGPQLESQAAEIVNSRQFKEYQVEYPDNGLNDMEFNITSLDQLDTMMSAFLKMVKVIYVVGDEVVDRNRGDNDVYYDNNRLCIEYLDNGEKVYPGKGTEKNLERLSRLSNAERIDIDTNPIESLDGIENFNNLNAIGIFNAPIKDFSQLFSVTTLNRVDIIGTGINSLEGIENLYNLEAVNLSWNDNLKDLTPLLGLENLRLVSVSKDMEKAIKSLEGADYQFELVITG